MSQKIPVHPANAPRPAGPYTPAIIAGDFVFCSGQIAQRPGTSELVQGDVKVQTRQTIENLKGILAAAGCTLADVVQSTVHLADLKRDFAGYNEVYREYFPEPFPTRVTVQSGLPDGVLVEIAVVALRPKG